MISGAGLENLYRAIATLRCDRSIAVLIVGGGKPTTPLQNGDLKSPLGGSLVNMQSFIQ
jgi:hypothetical protein